MDFQSFLAESATPVKVLVMLLSECCDIDRLRQIASHLYELLDANDTAEDTAKSDDKLFRQLVRMLYDRKTASGVHCPDGRWLYVDDALVAEDVKRMQTTAEQVLIGQMKMIAFGKHFKTVEEVTEFAARCLDAVPA